MKSEFADGITFLPGDNGIDRFVFHVTTIEGGEAKLIPFANITFLSANSRQLFDIMKKSFETREATRKNVKTQ